MSLSVPVSGVGPSQVAGAGDTQNSVSLLFFIQLLLPGFAPLILLRSLWQED